MVLMTGFEAPCQLSALVWLAPGAEVKLERASEKSPVWYGREKILRLNKCNSSQEKKKTEAAVVSGLANLSSTPALTAFNIFNTVKLEKWIACVNALILIALVFW